MQEYKPTQPMRIQARPGSRAERAYRSAALPGSAWPMPKALASGIDPAPLEDLIFHGGKLVPQMEFKNVYLGGAAQWLASDVESIDGAILRAMRHKGLNNMMRQYFPGSAPVCEKRDSIFFGDPPQAPLTEPDVDKLVTALYDAAAIAKTQLDTCLFNLLLPPKAILKLGDVGSLDGLGGFHGSLHLRRNNKPVTLYYSANVYSQHLVNGRENGIDVFDAPWKNVVATLYHELNEFRTDPDVSDAIEKGSNDFLGWSSRSGKEVGDQPIFQAGAAGDLALVFQEIAAPPGKKIPVQFLYSNAVHGAEGPVADRRP